MLAPEFLNALRIVQSLDAFHLSEAGIVLDRDQQEAFHRDPSNWLVRADSDTKLKIWSLVEARLPADVLPTPAHAEKAAQFLVLLMEAREHGHDWWAHYQLSQIGVRITQDRKIEALTGAVRKLLGVAVWDDDYVSREEVAEATAAANAALELVEPLTLSVEAA